MSAVVQVPSNRRPTPFSLAMQYAVNLRGSPSPRPTYSVTKRTCVCVRKDNGSPIPLQPPPNIPLPPTSVHQPPSNLPPNNTVQSLSSYKTRPQTSETKVPFGRKNQFVNGSSVAQLNPTCFEPPQYAPHLRSAVRPRTAYPITTSANLFRHKKHVSKKR